MVPATHAGAVARVLRWGLGAAVSASLLVSPRPVALLVRRMFAAKGAQLKRALDRHAPANVAALVDERYGDEADMLMDVFWPESLTGALPLVFWVHGGGWVGGSKDELGGYFKRIASEGYAVVGPRYSLAPEHHYPTPPRQMMVALGHLLANPDRFHLDPDRIVIAGDSAGTHISAQLGALVTTPGYADRVGIPPTLGPQQLRGLVLACGPYDLTLARSASSPSGRRFITAMLWAYSGKRGFLDDPAFAPWSITDNLTADYPPTLITVGNADPLRPHSERLAGALRTQGVQPDTVFWPDHHQPPLNHEYQFDLDTDEGQLFLERLLAFLHRTLQSRPQP
jgi:acetyl esterase/lipase